MNDAYTMAMDAKSRTEVLEERFDRHMEKIERAIERLDKKIEAQNGMELRLTQVINKVQLDAVQADNQTNLKVYGLISAISATIYGLGETIKHIFK